MKIINCITYSYLLLTFSGISELEALNPPSLAFSNYLYLERSSPSLYSGDAVRNVVSLSHPWSSDGSKYSLDLLNFIKQTQVLFKHKNQRKKNELFFKTRYVSHKF